MENMTLKERIVKEYGSINKFVDHVAPRMKMSRTHLYALLNKENTNPTLETLHELAELTNVPVEEVIREYSMRYRDQRPQG